MATRDRPESPAIPDIPDIPDRPDKPDSDDSISVSSSSESDSSSSYSDLSDTPEDPSIQTIADSIVHVNPGHVMVDSTLDNIEEQLGDIRNKVCTMRSEIADERAETANEIEDLKKINGSQTNDIIRLRRTEKEAVAKIKDAEGQTQALKFEKARYEREISGYKQEIEELKYQMDTKTKKIDDEVLLNRELKDNLVTTENTIGELEDELETLKTATTLEAAKQKDLQNIMNKQIQELLGQVSDHTQEIDSLQRANIDMEQRLLKTQREKAEVEDEVETFKQKAGLELHELRQQREDNKEQIDTLSQQLQLTKEESIKFEELYISTERRCVRHNEELNKIKEEHELEITELNKRLKDMNKEGSDLKSALDKLRRRSVEVTTDSDAHKQKVRELEAKMIEERARSDKNYDKLTKENAGVLSTNHEQHNQILTLDLQLQEKTRECERTENCYREEQIAKRRLDTDIKEMEIRLEKLARILQDRDGQISRLRSLTAQQEIDLEQVPRAVETPLGATPPVDDDSVSTMRKQRDIIMKLRNENVRLREEMRSSSDGTSHSEFLKQLQEDNKALKNNLRDQKAEVTRLIRNHQHLQEEKNALESRLSITITKLNNNIADLKEEKDAINDKHQTAKNQNSELSNLIASLKMDLNQTEYKFTMLKSDIDMYETQVKDLEDDLDTERNKNDRLDKIIRDMKMNDLEQEHKAKIAGLTASNKGLLGKLQLVEHELTGFRKKNNLQRQEMKSVQDDLYASQDRLRVLQRQFRELQDAYTSLEQSSKQRIGNRTKKMIELRGQMDDKDKMLKEILEEQNDSRNKSEEEKAQLMKELSRIEDEKDHCANQVEQLEIENKNEKVRNQHERIRYEEEIASIRDEKAKLEIDLQNNRNDKRATEEIQKRLIKLQEEKRAVEIQLHIYEDDFNREKQAREHTYKQLLELRANIERMKSEVSGTPKDDVKKLEMAIRAQKQVNARLDELVTKVLGENKTLSADLTQKCEQFNNEKAELTLFYTNRIKNLEEDVRMSGDERRTLIEELETERTRRAEVSTLYNQLEERLNRTLERLINSQEQIAILNVQILAHQNSTEVEAKERERAQQLEDMADDIAKLTAEKDDLQKKLQTVDSVTETDSLTQQIIIIEEKIQYSSIQITINDNVTTVVTGELKKITKERDGLKEEIATLNQRVADNKIELSKRKASLAAMEKQRTAKAQECTTLENMLQEERDKQEECDKLFDDLQAAYYETRDSLQAAQHELGNVQQELDNSLELAHRNREGDRDKLKERIADLKTEVEDVTEDLYECRREKEMKNKLLKDNEEQHKSLMGEIDLLKIMTDVYQADFAEERRDRENQHSKMDDLQKKNDALSSELRVLRNDMPDPETTQIGELKTEIKELEHREKVAAFQLKKKSEQVSSTQNSEYMELRESYDTVVDDVKDKVKQIKVVQDQNMALQKEMSKIKEQEERNRKEMMEKDLQHNGNIEKLGKYDTQITILQVTIADQKRELTTVRSQLEETNGAVVEYMEDMEKLKQDKERVSRQLKAKDEKTKNQVQTLQGVIGKQKAEITTLKNQAVIRANHGDGYADRARVAGGARNGDVGRGGDGGRSNHGDARGGVRGRGGGAGIPPRDDNFNFPDEHDDRDEDHELPQRPTTGQQTQLTGDGGTERDTPAGGATGPRSSGGGGGGGGMALRQPGQEIGELKTKIKELEHKEKVAAFQLKKKSEQVSSTQNSEYIELSEAYDTVVSDVKNKIKEIKHVQEQNMALQKEMSKIKDQEARNRAELMEKELQHNAHIENLGKYDRKINILQVTIADQKKELTTVRSQLADTDRATVKYMADMEKLKEDKERVSRQLKELQAKDEKTKNQVKTLQDVIGKQKAENTTNAIIAD